MLNITRRERRNNHNAHHESSRLLTDSLSWRPVEPGIAAILRIPNSDVYLELLEYRGIPQSFNDMSNGNIGNAHIAFFVDELEPLYERLTALGVKSVSPVVTPTIGPNQGGRAVYMIDPDGFRVELIETKRAFGDYRPAEAVTASARGS